MNTKTPIVAAPLYELDDKQAVRIKEQIEFKKAEITSKKLPVPISKITITKIAKEPEIPPTKSILKTVNQIADETAPPAKPAEEEKRPPKKSLSRKSSISDRRRSKAFSLSGTDSGPLLEPEYLATLEQDEKQKEEINTIQSNNLQPDQSKPPLPPNKKIFKSKQAQKESERAEKIELANKALYETTNKENQKKSSTNMQAISNYLTLSDDEENADEDSIYDPKSTKKKATKSVKKTTTKNTKEPKPIKAAKETTEAKKKKEVENKEEVTKKGTKTVLGERNDLTNTDTKKTSDPTSREEKKAKRSIETIYENQELDTSIVINSTTVNDETENKTPTKQSGLNSDVTYIVNKKQKLNDDSLRPDSPPLPTTSSEFSSRRNKKPISYKELPISQKMRCDKDAKVWIKNEIKK